MSERTTEDEQAWYVCGKCKQKVFYLKKDGRPERCTDPDCDWTGGELDPSDVPAEFKLGLTNY